MPIWFGLVIAGVLGYIWLRRHLTYQHLWKTVRVNKACTVFKFSNGITFVLDGNTIRDAFTGKDYGDAWENPPISNQYASIAARLIREHHWNDRRGINIARAQEIMKKEWP